MTLTLKNIPDDLEKALRERAATERVSIDALVIENLRQMMGLHLDSSKRRDLSKLAGNWTEEDEARFQEVRAMHERIDPGIWK